MPADNQHRGQLTAAVGRAGRRVRLNQTLQETAWAAAIALLGPVLLLLTGRQWFAWPLLLLFVLAGIAFAAWRLYRRRPTPYQVSQTLDLRLATQDQISTAVYFLDAASTAAAEQRRAAAGLAAAAPIEDVFPVAAPRSLYALAGVLVVASTLCAIRFFLEKPFRVDQPLVRVIQQALNPNGTPPKPPQGPHEQLQAKNKPQGIPIETPESLIAADRQPGEDPAKPGAAATSDPEPGRPPSGNPPDEASTSDPFGEPGAGDRDDMPIQSYEDMLERDAKNGLSKSDTKQGNNQDSSSNSNQAASAEANSLLSKLREAMNNMLSKLQQKPQGNGKQQAQQGSPSNSGEQQEGKGEGQQGSGQPQPGGEQGTEGEGAESDQQATGQGASAKSGAKASDGGQKGSSGDGAGQQDGDKAIQDALQQEALGKLTELYGRRAQNVTGEVTVEAQSGKQSLRTPLSAKQGTHRDAGGQVSRDEIPLAYQAYVKEYFSKIRQTEKK